VDSNTVTLKKGEDREGVEDSSNGEQAENSPIAEVRSDSSPHEDSGLRFGSHVVTALGALAALFAVEVATRNGLCRYPGLLFAFLALISWGVLWQNRDYYREAPVKSYRQLMRSRALLVAILSTVIAVLYGIGALPFRP